MDRSILYKLQLKPLLVEYCRPKCLAAQLEVVVSTDCGKVFCVSHLQLPGRLEQTVSECNSKTVRYCRLTGVVPCWADTNNAAATNSGPMMQMLLPMTLRPFKVL